MATIKFGMSKMKQDWTLHTSQNGIRFLHAWIFLCAIARVEDVHVRYNTEFVIAIIKKSCFESDKISVACRNYLIIQNKNKKFNHNCLNLAIILWKFRTEYLLRPSRYFKNIKKGIVQSSIRKHYPKTDLLHALYVRNINHWMKTRPVFKKCSGLSK